MFRTNEYEMLDHPSANPTEPTHSNSNVQADPETIGYNVNSYRANSNDPESDDSDSRRSSSSVIFDQIQDFTKDDADDFYSSPYFHSVFRRYKGAGANTKILALVGIVSVILWIGSVLVYSKASPKQIVSHFSGSNVQINGVNVTLNTYDPKYANVTLGYQRRGQYYCYREDIRWLSHRQYKSSTSDNSGGFYLSRGKEAAFEVRQIDNPKLADMVLKGNQFTYKNNFFYVQDIVLNPGRPATDPDTVHIVITDKIRQWRHSSFGIYWLYNMAHGVYTPIQPPDNLEKLNHPSALDSGEILDKLHFAEFSPNGEHLVFGFNHDLYLQDLKTNTIERMTYDSSKHIFNGKPDWVYEEEVLADYKALWWSPDSKNLVFMSLNDTKVQEYEIDYYIKDRTEIGIQYEESDQVKVESVNRYPIKTAIKYPKPGSDNPEVSLFNYNIEQKKLEFLPYTLLGKEFIVYDGVWIDSKHFLMKLTDRTSKIMHKVVFEPQVSLELKKVAEVDSNDYNGWIGKQTKVAVIPAKDPHKDNSYIDKVVVDSRTHLALFDSAMSATHSKLLTKSDEWEITSSSPIAYDVNENYVYALSTIKSSMDAHLIGVELDQLDVKTITSVDEDGVFEVEFSEDGQYLNLNYNGPKQPWQRLLNMGNVHDFLGKDNERVGIDEYIDKAPTINYYEITEKNLKDINFPTKSYRTVTVGKNPDNTPINLNMIEILPPNFDPNPKRKYPLLVHVYGGPGSQTVDKSFDVDFQDVVSASLDSIVLVIDPRGTGGQGWVFESAARDRIGYWEPRDITTAVSEYIAVNGKFVDKEKTAIWGWSYGGFTTLKTLEFDAGNTFKFGMAVAPVTYWLFYDSIYTERIMGLQSQSDFYEKYARVSDYLNFRDVKRFLIMHGTSDDNVHLQNSLWLIDKFNLDNVENYDVSFFPDSDHSINYHNANSVVYDKLFSWLKQAFNGKYDDL